jgi:hypothetical protein
MTEREKLLAHMENMKRKEALNKVFTWGPNSGLKPGEISLIIAGGKAFHYPFEKEIK